MDDFAVLNSFYLTLSSSDSTAKFCNKGAHLVSEFFIALNKPLEFSMPDWEVAVVQLLFKLNFKNVSSFRSEI